MKRVSFRSGSVRRAAVVVAAACTFPLWVACSLNPVSEDPSVSFSDDDRGSEVLEPSSSAAPAPNPGLAPTDSAAPSVPPSPVATTPIPEPTSPTSPGTDSPVTVEPVPPESGPTQDDAAPGEELEAGSDAGFDAGVDARASTGVQQPDDGGGAVGDAAAP